MGRTAKLLVLLLALSAAACGSDDQDPPEECPAGERQDPIRGGCVREQPTPDMSNGSDAGNQDATTTDASRDQGGDEGSDSGPPPNCPDGDGDGHYDESCGGDDCDDQDPLRHPGLTDLCNDVDDDCDGVLNDGVECTFYAHSDTTLYKVDPFAKTAEALGPVPDLWDMDTHPDGTLYGITADRLHSFDEATGQWIQAPQRLGLIADGANAMAIDNDGTVFIMSGSLLFTVDLNTGVASSVGSMFPAHSSGDCVVTKGNVLYMTSSHTSPDSLVRVDGSTGAATTVGNTGHGDIWGLTAAWNRVFGMTGDGVVVEIDVMTGIGRPIHLFNDIAFYGAASTPTR